MLEMVVSSVYIIITRTRSTTIVFDKVIKQKKMFSFITKPSNKLTVGLIKIPT